MQTLEPYNLEHFGNSFWKKKGRQQKLYNVEVCTNLKLM